jgi:Tfp pilus assembly protein PilP
MAAPPTRGRNPFAFGSSVPGQPGAGAPSMPDASTLPEAPLPLPEPDLKLLGIAADAKTGRTAVISAAGDLVLAKEGETIAERYRVTRVGEDAVDLVDAVGNRPLQLKLP